MPKGKMTLSIDQVVIEEISRESKRERISISQLVEDFLRVYVTRKKVRRKSWAERTAGSMAGKIKESDVFRDDRVGHILRKTGWGQEVMKKHGKA